MTNDEVPVLTGFIMTTEISNRVKLRSVKDSSLKKGTRVILRVDFNVPLRQGKVLDDFRVRESLAVIKYILERDVFVRIISHLGRPEGRLVSSLSMKPLALYLEKVLKRRVVFVKDPLDEKLLKKYGHSSEIIFFENIRFWSGEEKDNFYFAKKLARWGDVYVNEAFSNCHRKHASIVSLAKILPSFAGPGLEKEIRSLGSLFDKPARPFVAVLGGAKVSTKLPLIKRFLRVADKILIGGAMANTVFLTQGFEIGKSTAERELKKIIPSDIFRNKKIFLPLDVITVSGGKFATARTEIRNIDVGLAQKMKYPSGHRSAILLC